jgi:phytoene dehydrogenase-like protein
MMKEYEEVKGAFGASRYTPVDFGPTLEQRLAERSDRARWLRRIRESAFDVILREFEHPRSRAFMLWMAFMTMQPPDRPGTGALAYSLAYGRQNDSWIVPKGGSGQLPAALIRLLEDHGSEVRVGHPVTSLVIEGGRCVGVETATGEVFRAEKAVLSTIHIKHLVPDFRYGVETWRAGISMMATHYATTTAPTYSTPSGDLTPLASGLAVSVERMLQIGHDFNLRRVNLDDPPLLVLCPTVADPGRAPAGRHTLKVVGFQPYELAEGPEHWDQIKHEAAAANLEHLGRYAPNLVPETILATVVKSPLDLERTNAHNWHGSCHGGDQDWAQSGSLRPAPGWAQHRMPIPGLYQTGSTTHPGASVSGGPGRNAAWVLLTDLGFDFAAVARS